MRLILFVIFMGVLTRLGWWAFGKLRLSVDQTSFFFGVVLTMISGALVFRLSDWYSTATRPNRPQTVTLETKDTPRRITLVALGATFWIIVTVACLAGAAYVAVFVIK